ncbi:dTDP-4-dehydrorhamnose reductase [Planctomycetes bacterium Pla163]|uniref:dTDP-4-dehydrorhamnose reductase n=1 Tax=Rohdeia mirabilis TaxID=2528008 RepID=A0A518D356_9BACT|nr:dTDP-4-dehydrorhamnose reductase [Planctomycetes bacterium Pla163]
MQPASEAPTFVLGTSGFLGRAVVEALLARRAAHACGSVVAAGPRPFEAAGLVPRPVDGSVPGAVESALDLHRPGAVLCVAALARGGDCEADPARAERLNTELPAEVARWCERHGARLVHVSTDLVFGGEAPDRVLPAGGRRESDPVAPLGVYARTKAAGEAAVLAACPQALVARLPLLYGDSRGRGLGASDGLLAACRAGRDVTLFDDEWRTPLDVDLAARALVRLLDRAASGIVHLGGERRLSRAEFGFEVLAAAGLDAAGPGTGAVRAAPRAALGLAAERPADVCLASERARLLLGDGWNRSRVD